MSIIIAFFNIIFPSIELRFNYQPLDQEVWEMSGDRGGRWWEGGGTLCFSWLSAGGTPEPVRSGTV